MARVIKAGANAGSARPARPATRMLAQADMKKVIEKELFVAKQEAEELLKRADEERRIILTEGRHKAAQMREEAMSRGASEAFAQAAEEALLAFRRRAMRYDEAADDVRILALEIVKKLLGNAPDIGAKDIDRILGEGMSKLRARRRVRVVVPTGRREELLDERPNLMKAVDAEPDLLVEESADVSLGFARVVTEVGGALCAEDSALAALADVVNVKETPRRPGGGAGQATQVGLAPTNPRVSPPTGGLDDELSALDELGDLDALPDADIDGDDDIDDIDDIADIDASQLEASELEASELDASGDSEALDEDRTRALPSPLPRLRGHNTATGEAPMSRRPVVREAPPPPRHENRVPTGAVQPGRRAATRVIAVSEREELVAQARQGGTRPDLGADDEDDLDLFTDERPQRRR